MIPRWSLDLTKKTKTKTNKQNYICFKNIELHCLVIKHFFDHEFNHGSHLELMISITAFDCLDITSTALLGCWFVTKQGPEKKVTGVCATNTFLCHKNIFLYHKIYACATGIYTCGTRVYSCATKVHSCATRVYSGATGVYYSVTRMFLCNKSIVLWKDRFLCH